MLTQLVDLITFRAFRPEPKDWRESVARRFPRKRILVYEVGFRGYRILIAKIGRNGAIHFEKCEELLFREIGAELKMLSELAKKFKIRHVVVMAAGAWEPIRCATTFHGKDYERAKLLREEPEKVFTAPSRLDKNKRHTFVAHPEFEHGIAFALAPDRVDEAVQAIESKTSPALTVVRATVGVFVLLDDIADDHYEKLPDNGWLFVADLNGFLLVRIEEREWADVGYRSKKAETTGDDAVETVLQRMDPDAEFVVADGSDYAIAETIRKWQTAQGRDARVVEIFGDLRGAKLTATCALDD